MKGHAAAAFTVLVWGSTFVSTKVLLLSFGPVEILFWRFIIGYAALWAFAPRRLRSAGWKHELLFAVSGLTGVTLNYLLETFALQYTKASNLAVIVSITPLITAVTVSILHRERLRGSFFLGFLLSFSGICLISFSNGAVYSPHLGGDLLGLGVAVVWTIYTVVSEKLSASGYDVILMTRRIFFYGIVFMIPFAVHDRALPNITLWAQPRNLALLLYLGIAACALSYMTWNYAVHALGSLRSNLYFYFSPLITVTFSVLILHESVSPQTLFGMALTLLGVAVSGNLYGTVRGILQEKKSSRGGSAKHGKESS